MHLRCLRFTILTIQCGFGPCLLKNAERNLRYHVDREAPKNTKQCQRTNGFMRHYVMIL